MKIIIFLLCCSGFVSITYTNTNQAASATNSTSNPATTAGLSNLNPQQDKLQEIMDRLNSMEKKMELNKSSSGDSQTSSTVTSTIVVPNPSQGSSTATSSTSNTTSESAVVTTSSTPATESVSNAQSTSGTATTTEEQICLVPYIPWSEGNYFLAEYEGKDPRIGEVMEKWGSAVDFYYKNSIPMLPTELAKTLGEAGIEVVFDRSKDDLIEDMGNDKCDSKIVLDKDSSTSRGAANTQSINNSNKTSGIPNSRANSEDIPVIRNL